MSERTRVRRLPEKASYDAEVIASILDASLVCHLAFVRDGKPVAIPTIHALVGNTVYVHGSKGAGNLRALKKGIDVCVAVTIVDGIVAARSLFEHSMRYRSAVVFGRSRLVEGAEERTMAFRAISEHVLPGRWDDARGPSRIEDRQTTIIAVEIEEASAKVSEGWPEDAEEDLDLGVWAGVIPMRLAMGEPVPAPDLAPGVPVPDYISDLVAGRD
jgi:nitroimidazol reductase NimA-like FMN-containing flavoprotein (pyridoxamine 5'-phosphate oxidase superfamily)